jgi:hypothetical protein
MLWLLLIVFLPDSTCVICHSDLRGAYERSIHTQVGIGCTACHGGRSGTLNMRRAHSGNYKGVPKWRNIPLLCSSCHGDPEAMRPYGVPIDQLPYYKSSAHGKGWLKGVPGIALCTDCHGVHDILPAKDPRSPVNPSNIPETCARCHSDKKLMSTFGISSEIPEEYKKSIHYEELKKGNPRAPTCVTCHGTHGASPAGIEEIEEICGTCHRKTAQAFTLSPHERAFLERDLPECSACHGNHNIVVFKTSDLLNSCRNCHTEKKNLEVGERIQAIFLSTEEMVDKAQKEFERVLAKGLPLLDLEPRLRDGRTYLLAAYPLFHSLDIDTLQVRLRKARSIAEEVVAEIHEREGKKKERIFVLLLFWFYVLLTLGISEARRRVRSL